MYTASVTDPEKFWSGLGREWLHWRRDFDAAHNVNHHNGNIQWFTGGSLNAAENCVDRHAARQPQATALIWEKDEPGMSEKVSYLELQEEVSRLANALQSRGVRKGDRVCIYLPTTPYAVYAMLACARIGAIHSVVFAGFSAEALRSRIIDAGCQTIITADEGLRGGKRFPLKVTVDKAIDGLDFVKTVFVQERTGASVAATRKDVHLQRAMEQERPYCPPATMDSEDPLFILYTSGSTGTPKGLLHTTGGYLVNAGVSHKVGCLSFVAQ